MSVVRYQIVDEIGVIRLNNPPVNALSQALRQGLIDVVNAAQRDSTQALLIVCEGRTFIAGADIREFNKPPQAPSLPEVMEVLESSRKPVVAALHGNALGGGLEIAMACHYRCALPGTKLGLPEVNLGLLPGAGGTQRASRLMGIEPALKLITSGEPISAAEALDTGLIDQLLDVGIDGREALESSAIAYMQSLLSQQLSQHLSQQEITCRRVRDIALASSSETRDLLERYRQQLAKRRRGQTAPQLIVDCVADALTLPFDQGLAAERQRFLDCKQSPQSSAMRHVFFAEREAAKVAGISKEVQPRTISCVAVIGGGTMGAGIAINLANAGLPVTLLEISQEALARGLETIQKSYQQSVSKGKLSQDQCEQKLALIAGSTDYADLAEVDLVIEAVFENLEVKQQVFRQLDSVCKPGAILATNTSYQDVNLIANATARPEDVIGLHFFSPAHIMKLLEVIRGESSADDVILTAMKLAKIIGKLPVLAGNCYGFIGNRILRQYMAEAQRCLIEGATPEQIDGVMERWGMAMGPLAVGDLAGLDISYKARQALTDAQKGGPLTYVIPDSLVEMGRLGQKTGKGYYCYDPLTRKRSSDPEVLVVVEACAAAHNIQRRVLTDEEILNRLTFAMINEGAKILSEGIAQRPSDIDMVYVYGYGFPKFRGGPMHYADSIGLAKIVESMGEFGGHWQPAALLKSLAEQGKGFAQWLSDKN